MIFRYCQKCKKQLKETEFTVQLIENGRELEVCQDCKLNSLNEDARLLCERF